ncbi:MAG: retroviral-like aspartic protease family protein [Gammaproteobacteria bacterium]|nr:retroviral-like aspartic protease family protein [Gammaproteobacteria bacterium]
MLTKYNAIILLTLMMCNPSYATDVLNSLPMREKGASTYYVSGHITGYGATEFMVDTGSGYTTINEDTLKILQVSGNAKYLKNLKGILADGSEKIVPVYLLYELKLGASCELRDVEAAVFPGKTRHILGLNTLKKTGAFTFSFEPPALLLNSCESV